MIVPAILKWSSEKFGVRQIRKKKPEHPYMEEKRKWIFWGRFCVWHFPFFQTRQGGQSWNIGLKRRYFAHWIEPTIVGQRLLRNPEVTGSNLDEVFIRSRHGRFAVKKKKRSCSWYWCRSRAREKLSFVCVIFRCESCTPKAAGKEKILKEVNIAK